MTDLSMQPVPALVTMAHARECELPFSGKVYVGISALFKVGGAALPAGGIGIACLERDGAAQMFITGFGAALGALSYAVGSFFDDASQRSQICKDRFTVQFADVLADKDICALAL